MFIVNNGFENLEIVIVNFYPFENRVIVIIISNPHFRRF